MKKFYSMKTDIEITISAIHFVASLLLICIGLVEGVMYNFRPFNYVGYDMMFACLPIGLVVAFLSVAFVFDRLHKL